MTYNGDFWQDLLKIKKDIDKITENYCGDSFISKKRLEDYLKKLCWSDEEICSLLKASEYRNEIGICYEHGRIMLHDGLCHDCRNKNTLSPITCQHNWIEELTTAGKYRRCTKCYQSERT